MRSVPGVQGIGFDDGRMRKEYDLSGTESIDAEYVLVFRVVRYLYCGLRRGFYTRHCGIYTADPGSGSMIAGPLVFVPGLLHSYGIRLLRCSSDKHLWGRWW